MQISIIPADKTIVVDGVALAFDFALWSKKIHAIQWNGASGSIEFKTGATQWFDNYALIEDVIVEYDAEKQRLVDEAARLAAIEAEV